MCFVFFHKRETICPAGDERSAGIHHAVYREDSQKLQVLSFFFLTRNNHKGANEVIFENERRHEKMGRIYNLKVHEKELYRSYGINTIVIEGDYEGRHFVVLRHHSGHPNAYVEVLKDDCLCKEGPSEFGKTHGYDDRYEHFSGNVHGGATYYGYAYWDDQDERTYIGWDYGHLGDYVPAWEPLSYIEDEGYRWSIAEILMDVAHAVDGFEYDNATWESKQDE